ncbi:hypothetical protein KW799_01845, partial [Candidatus Parcubacteria bacterium]|nr:hypothetical protein [Candidatus Parcubacteria bacterium]
GRFENPRRQFLDELAALYRLIQKPISTRGFWEDSEMPIEQKIEALFHRLNHYGASQFPAMNEKNFPLLFTLSRKFGFPGATFPYSEAGIAGAELMGGIEAFLRQQRIADIPSAPSPQEFSLFDTGSWMRALAETFYAEKLDMVRGKLPGLLGLIVRILPESGPQLADSIYEVAERIHELGMLGVPSQDIAESVFKKRSA